MLVTESRPRNLQWFHAGPLLYGDWGTSRLYVLGLAFFYTANTTVLYLVAIALLMVAVSWAYTIVCRLFPDGGGVYTASRQLSPTLSVVGATLLLCGYLITAGISVVEAMHYFGAPDGPGLIIASLGVIGLIGSVNWLGARSAGRFAMVVAFAALAVSGIMAVLVLPYLSRGFENISLGGDLGAWPRWTAFTQIVLALAGVEAVANMTGLMKKPVAKTSKRTIWPVLVEVIALNLVFGVALTGIVSTIPELQGIDGPHAGQVESLSPEAAARVNEIKNTAMEVVAETAAANALGPAVGGVFGKAAAIVFGLLLLSATNTAVMAMVSVLFAMSQDQELPKPLAKLNYSGVPWVGLVASCAVSALIILIERRPEKLAELYIIGVCGAITVSVVSVAMNRGLGIRRTERLGMYALGGFLTLVTLTIVVTKLNATAFAGVVIGSVLTTRAGMRWAKARQPEPLEPERGWLAEVKRQPVALDAAKPRIMLAARGRSRSEYAVEMARTRGAILFAIYVRTLRVMDMAPGRVPRVEDDPAAQQALGTTALLAREAGVPFVPIYVTSPNITEEILDYTVTYGCETLIMGKSRRSLVSRRVEGDVVAEVANALPDNVWLDTEDSKLVPRRRPAGTTSGS